MESSKERKNETEKIRIELPARGGTKQPQTINLLQEFQIMFLSATEVFALFLFLCFSPFFYLNCINNILFYFCIEIQYFSLVM